jgi:hypothetical protein
MVRETFVFNLSSSDTMYLSEEARSGGCVGGESSNQAGPKCVG